MASIEKREFISKRTGKETTHYYVRYYEGRGKNRKRKSLPGAFTNQHNAKAARDRMLAEQAAGTFGRAEPKTILFSDFADQWLRDYAALKRGSTQDDYSGVVNKHLKPFFGDRDLKQITPEEVQGFVTAELETGYKPRTVNKVITIANMMFKHAEMWGYLDVNPARFVERPREQKKERDYLKPDEVRRQLEVTPEKYLPVFATGVLAGLREGELLALRWSELTLNTA